MKNIRVASVQFEHAAGDKQANLAKIRNYVVEAAGQGVDLIVFPECCITGYLFMRQLTKEQLESLAEPVPCFSKEQMGRAGFGGVFPPKAACPSNQGGERDGRLYKQQKADSPCYGPSSQALKALATEHKITIGAGLVEMADDGRMYNTYVVAMPNGQFQRHRKIHCFISEYLSCGSEFTMFDMPQGCRVAVLTCYDNNIGENVRLAALNGAEILLAPHQTGGCKTPSPRCMGVIDRSLWENRQSNPKAIEAELKGPKGRQWLLTWLPARAHDNGLFLIFSNGVGIDGDEIRTGNAMILDPYGQIITETWKAGDDMVVADLNPALRENCTGVRWIKTRRPELYTQLTVPTGVEEDIRRVRFSDELDQ